MTNKYIHIPISSYIDEHTLSYRIDREIFKIKMIINK